MKRPPGPESLDRQRSLRAFSTDAERLLWSHLRGRRLVGHKFRPQMWLGNYIVDFIYLERGLIIEADGGQHTAQAEYDAHRTAFLEKEGFRVLRFWNNDVLTNLDGVMTVISGELKKGPSPSQAAGLGPTLSPEGRG